MKATLAKLRAGKGRTWRAGGSVATARVSSTLRTLQAPVQYAVRIASVTIAMFTRVRGKVESARIVLLKDTVIIV